MARNRFYEERSLAKALGAATDSCVFVSHRTADSDAAEAIARYLRDEVGVDVYIATRDSNLAQAVSTGDHRRIVNYIETGIAASTHLLGVVGSATKGSWWVPFEVGAARQRKLSVAYVLLDEIADLPSYFEIADLISDEDDLDKWARKVRGSRLILKAYEQRSLPSIPRLPSIKHITKRFMVAR